MEASAPTLSGEAVERPPRPTTSPKERGETSVNRQPADDERKIERKGGGCRWGRGDNDGKRKINDLPIQFYPIV